ncbi:hypothetical protein QYF61_013459 [Mycteria americana]|uniref:Uncharacterized protein n=1 Tax=Mycteria americana TaxID=33587 RepID=A0AAN7N217_MYCAM|nr:hypothetical protein QYF61_013459 [Mycteria americana]
MDFQAKQPQFPQLLLIRLVLQTLHRLRWPSLDTLQHLNVPLVVRGPKLNTAFECWLTALQWIHCTLQHRQWFFLSQNGLDKMQKTTGWYAKHHFSQNSLNVQVVKNKVSPGVEFQDRESKSQVEKEGLPLNGLWRKDKSMLDKVHLKASVAVDEVHAAAVKIPSPEAKLNQALMKPLPLQSKSAEPPDSERASGLRDPSHAQCSSPNQHRARQGQHWPEEAQEAGGSHPPSLGVYRTETRAQPIQTEAWNRDKHWNSGTHLTAKGLEPGPGYKPRLKPKTGTEQAAKRQEPQPGYDPRAIPNGSATVVAREAKQPQLPQPLLIRLLLQTLHQLPCPSLDTLQNLNVSLVVRGPKLNAVFEVRPHQCRVQGHDHFPSPAGLTISDTSQDAIGLLGHLGTLLAHIHPSINWILFHQAAFQPLLPKPVALHGVVVTQVQDPALGLVEPHTIGLGPSIQPVQPFPNPGEGMHVGKKLCATCLRSLGGQWLKANTITKINKPQIKQFFALAGERQQSQGVQFLPLRCFKSAAEQLAAGRRGRRQVRC